MARVSRGYHSYRGRGSKWKIVLAVLLVLVIVAAVAVIMLQKYIFYDETGTPHLDVPWQEETAEAPPEDPVDLDLVVDEPDGPTEGIIRAVSVPVGLLTQQAVEDTLQAAGAACNAVAVTVKDDAGNLYFEAEAAAADAVNVAEDTPQALLNLTGEDSELYTIARLSCFHDPKAANADVEGKGLKNTGGYIFYDGSNSQWLDPAKPEACQYLCSLARETAELGFDEILLTDVTYPTEGKLNKIDYGQTPISDHIQDFLEQMRTALEPYAVAISIELPTEVITQGEDATAGLVLSEIAPWVDRIYTPANVEDVETLTQTVEALEGTVTFVPILSAESGGEDSVYLILS